MGSKPVWGCNGIGLCVTYAFYLACVKDIFLFTFVSAEADEASATLTCGGLDGKDARRLSVSLEPVDVVHRATVVVKEGKLLLKPHSRNYACHLQ